MFLIFLLVPLVITYPNEKTSEFGTKECGVEI